MIWVRKCLITLDEIKMKKIKWNLVIFFTMYILVTQWKYLCLLNNKNKPVWTQIGVKLVCQNHEWINLISYNNTRYIWPNNVWLFWNGINHEVHWPWNHQKSCDMIYYVWYSKNKNKKHLIIVAVTGKLTHFWHFLTFVTSR